MTFRIAGLAGVFLGLLIGCGQAHFPADYPTILEDVVAIRDNTALTPQQKREALYELGFSDEVINGLLRTIRLGNQFGGDLRSAYNKVVGDRMADLTPDEAQVYGDEGAGIQLNDDAARAITRFFHDNGLNSRDALEAYLDSPGAFVPPGVDEEEVREIFIDFNADLLIPKLPTV